MQKVTTDNSVARGDVPVGLLCAWPLQGNCDISDNICKHRTVALAAERCTTADPHPTMSCALQVVMTAQSRSTFQPCKAWSFWCSTVAHCDSVMLPGLVGVSETSSTVCLARQWSMPYVSLIALRVLDGDGMPLVPCFDH